MSTSSQIRKDPFIYPYKDASMQYWSKKWHISPEELQEAIMETGSLDARKIRQHLVRNGKTTAGAFYKLKEDFLRDMKNVLIHVFLEQRPH